MARQLTLAQVRNKVKAECGKSTDASSTAQDSEINQIIEDVQGMLAATIDWPFLKCRWDSSLVAGVRYQAFPTTDDRNVVTAINFERPVTLMIKWNMIWQPVVYGIDEYPELNYIDSDRSQVLDPIQRWQFSDETQFEVWPRPASASALRFIGQRALTSLQTGATTPPTWNDSATLDLDDLLVTFYASVEYLLREENPKAKLVAEKAERRMRMLQGSYPIRKETICIGRGNPLDRKAIRQVPLVLVAGR